MVALLAAVSPSAAAPTPSTAEECAATAEHAADLRDGGRLRDAAAAFAVCARDACPRIVRDDCRRGLQDLDERGPHLISKLRDADGHDVADADLALDDQPLSVDARTRGLLVDPGTHVLSARRGGAVVARSTVIVTANDGLRTVELTLARPAPARSPEAPPPTAASKAPWIVGGVGLALVVVGSALGAWTYADYRDLEESCRPDCASSRVDPVHTRGVVADVALGLGVVTLAGALVLRLAGAPSAPPRAAAGLSW